MIRQRALMMAVETGDMPNIDLIWMAQQADHHIPCFGQGENCQQQDCKWRHQCLALTGYKPQPGGRPQRLTA